MYNDVNHTVYGTFKSAIMAVNWVIGDLRTLTYSYDKMHTIVNVKRIKMFSSFGYYYKDRIYT